MRIVEFYGLPASGKSHHANRLSKSGNSVRPAFHSRWEMIRYAAVFWFRHPRFTFSLLLVILRNSSGLKDIAIKCLNGLGYRLAYYYCPIKAEISLVHEGMLHNIFSLSDRVMEKKVIGRLVSSMPALSSAFLYLEVSKEERMKRAKERGRILSRVKDMDRQLKLDEIMSVNLHTLNECIEANENLRRKRFVIKDDSVSDIHSIL